MVRPGIRVTPPTRSGPHQRRTGVRDDRCALRAGRGGGLCTLSKEATNRCDKPYTAACWSGGAEAGGGQVLRRTTMGSIVAARRAGTRQAKVAMTRSTAPVTTKVAASLGRI